MEDQYIVNSNDVHWKSNMGQDIADVLENTNSGMRELGLEILHRRLLTMGYNFWRKKRAVMSNMDWNIDEIDDFFNEFIKMQNIYFDLQRVHKRYPSYERDINTLQEKFFNNLFFG